MILGLGAGAVIAALAIGVVLTYRASGVINFAHAAVGMFLGFVYYELRSTGDLVLPFLGLPARIPVFTAGVPGRRALVCCGIPTAETAFAITMIYAGILGLLIYVLLFRPLRAAPPLARVVASLGLFLYLFALADLRFGAQGAALGGLVPILPTRTVDAFGVTVPQDRYWLAGLVVLTTAVLWAIFHWTRFGLATRAAAENEKGAVLLGHSPERLAAANWVLAVALAGAAVVLAAPISGLDPSGTSLLIVPALAAALVGGFRSFWLTCLGGLGIGMLESWLLELQTDHPGLPDGLQVAVPLVLIVVLMAVRGEPLPSRGALRHGHFPHSPTPRAVIPTAIGLGGLAVVALLTVDSEWRQAIILSAIFAVIALSIVVLTGYVGQISLAPIAFAGIAAFAMVKLTAWGVPFPLAPLGGAAVATAVGLVVGIPAVRVRGLNLAIVTLATAVVVEELVLGWEWFIGSVTGTDVPEPELFGVDLGVAATGADFPRAVFGIVCVVTLAGAAIGVACLRRSRLGLRFLAVRSNERAAAAAGINVARLKLGAFGLSAFLAGLGGTLLAYQRQVLSADSFAVFDSLALLATTYLTGIASIGGGLLAGAFTNGGLVTVVLGSEGSEYQFAVNGVALMVIAVLYPNGITGAAYALANRVWKNAARRAGRATPAPTR